MKKRLKNIVAIVLAIAFVFSLVGVSAFAGSLVSVSGVSWSGDAGDIAYDDEVITITGSGTLTFSEDTKADVEIAGGAVSIAVADNVSLTGTISISSSATATLSGGIYSSSSAVIQNEGVCTISGGTYSNEASYYTVVNNGTMTINGGTFFNNYSATLIINSQNCNGAVLTINGGTFTTDGSACVKNDENGTLKITGGMYNNSENYGIVNYGKAEVSNSDIEGWRGIYNAYSEGSTNSLTVSSSTITAESYAIWNYNAGASATVSGCTFTSAENYAVVNSGTSLTLADSTISGTLGVLTISGAATAIDNCDITASVYCAVYNDGSTTTISGGTYTAAGICIFNYSSDSGTITIYHGSFSDISADSYLASGYTNDSGETVTTYSVTNDTSTEVHAFVKVEATEATCTEDGNIEYYYCAYWCDTPYFTADADGNLTSVSKDSLTIAAIGHSYESETTKEATYTENGEITYTCSVCGDTYTEIIDAVGHSYVSEITKEATCTEDGEITYTCSVCGDTYTDVVVAGHSYDDGVITTEATCTENGEIIYTCLVCGDTYTEIVEAEHSYVGEITKEATCTEDGTVVYTCSVCGDTYTESITATGHSYDGGVVTKEATEDEDGVMTYTCSVCGKTITESIEYVAESSEAASDSSAAATGDTNRMFLWVSLAAVAIIGTAFVSFKIKFSNR